MRQALWAATLGVLFLVSGCLSGVGPGSGDGAPDPRPGQATLSGEPRPRLPGNLTLADGHVVERSQQQITWRWSGTLELGPASLATDDPPKATTSVPLPPGTWVRVNATLEYAVEGTDLDLEITEGVLSLCQWDAIDGGRAQEPVREDAGEDRENCEARPNPRGSWRSWTLTVIGNHWDPRAPEQAPFDVTVTLEALEAPWSDTASSRSPGEGWPSIDEAVIRPGSKIKEDEGCTANFVFEAPDNSSLYVGTAAHCVDGWGVGTVMGIASLPNAGRLVYCSWGTMEANQLSGCPPPEDSLVDKLDNDFALLEIRPDLRHLVHPALLHRGGPTGIADEAEQGTRVIVYGNSSLRDGFQSDVPGPADPIEGYLVHPGFNEWETYLNTVGGVPGDSGSPVITETGLALGVVRSLEICDVGRPWQTIADLAPALSFLRDRTELEVELATFPLVEGNSLPASPVKELSPICGGGP